MPSIVQIGNEVKEIDLLEGLVPVYEASVNQWIGKIRQGKTYSATAQAIDDLEHGHVVYTSWRINWNGYDERDSWWKLFLGRLGLKKYFKVYPASNLHYLPFDGIEKDLSYYAPYTNFLDKFLSLTDCDVYLDEGQVAFNSYERTNISQKKQDAILFTGHFNRTINIISQRPSAIHAIMRANISRYYKIEKEEGWLGVRFRRLEYQDTTEHDLPDLSKEPEEIVEYRANQKIFDAYDSKYMRGSVVSSQSNFAQMFQLSKEVCKKLLVERKLKQKNEKNS